MAIRPIDLTILQDAGPAAVTPPPGHRCALAPPPSWCSPRPRAQLRRDRRRRRRSSWSTWLPRPASIWSTSRAGRPRTTSLTPTATAPRFFDYDNDGDLDILLVNGSTREQFARGGDPMVALYRNDGRARFTRRHGRQRLRPARLGCRHLRRRLRQRRLRRRLRDGLRRRRALAQQRHGHVRGRDPARRRRRYRAGAPAARSATTTATAIVDLYVANYVRFDERLIPGAGHDGQLPVHGDRCLLRADAAARRAGRPVPQQRRRHVHRRDGGGRNRRPGPLRLRRHLRRPRRRWLAGHLRGQRLQAQSAVPQPPRRPLRRGGAACRRRAQQPTAARRRAWASTPATTTATASRTWSSPTSRTITTRSTRTGRRACSPTSATRSGLASTAGPLPRLGRRLARCRPRRPPRPVHRQRPRLP